MSKANRKWLVEDGNLEAFGTSFDPGGAMSPENVIEMYAGVRHMLSAEHREYLDRLEQGEINVDPLMHLEMLLVLMSVYSTQTIQWSMEAGKPNRDVAPIVGELRQTATAVENIKIKRQEVSIKRGDDTGVVDPTRKSPMARFKNLHGGDTGE